MLFIALLSAIALAFFCGLFDDQNPGQGNPNKDTNIPDDTQFDPWKDEWYGNGPWWKKW